MQVDEVQIRYVSNAEDGLIAWVSCVINGEMRINNIQVRTGRDDQFYLSYPRKPGTKHSMFNPISKEASQALEAAILPKVVI
jgi:DNA-binding cell septation regulator SpoVG